MRDFVAQNQALADSGRTVIVPRTSEDIERRDAALRRSAPTSGEHGRAAYTALDLPSYPAAA